MGPHHPLQPLPVGRVPLGCPICVPAWGVRPRWNHKQENNWDLLLTTGGSNDGALAFQLESHHRSESLVSVEANITPQAFFSSLSFPDLFDSFPWPGCQCPPSFSTPLNQLNMDAPLSFFPAAVAFTPPPIASSWGSVV